MQSRATVQVSVKVFWLGAAVRQGSEARDGVPDLVRHARSVLFVISEDWFFVSHFLPLAAAMVEAGYEVGVLCRINDPASRGAIEQAGIRIIETPSFRDRTGPRDQVRQIARIVAILRRERPTIVHLVSLRMVVIGGLAALAARVPVRVLALTGLGLLGAARSPRSRVGLLALRGMMRHVIGGGRTIYLFENTQDASRLGIDPHGPTVEILGGAGIDPLREAAQPMPGGATLKVAVVARMIFSKGIAVAVEAVTQARQAGADVALTLVGMPDPGNPRSLGEEALRAFASRPGIAWVGRSNDVAAVWRDHHVACVPSLGGEGLPRALLEGAAAGRPVVTTRTPGCARFVRDGVEGVLVPPGDPGALAAALTALSRDRARVQAMGLAARTRVLDGFTVRHVADAVMRQYDLALGGDHAKSRSGSPAAWSRP